MSLKLAVNKTLHSFGYTVVRNDTLARITQSAQAQNAPSGPLDDAPSERPCELANEPIVSPGPIPDPRLMLLPSENQPPRMCTALAPGFDPLRSAGRFGRNIQEFHQNGITVIATGAAQAARWRLSETVESDVGNRHPAWDWAGNSLVPYSDDLRTGIPSAALIADLTQLFTSDDFGAFFLGVLGCPISVGNCRLVKSLPHSGEGFGPQSWHQDGTPPGVIRGVLYLTDVGEKSGPFQYKDETGAEHTVLGTAGDLLVFDAMRLLHRAVPPERDVRMAIDLVFIPRLPGQEFRIIIAGMNHWPADPFFYQVPAARTDSSIRPDQPAT
jgi:hypothetical protein